MFACPLAAVSFAEVARIGFYAWQRPPLSERAIEAQRLLGLIRASYKQGAATGSF